MTKVTNAELLTEVERAVAETREALSDLACRQAVSAPLMAMATLIDKITVAVEAADGDASFELREKDNTVVFTAGTLRKIITQMIELTAEIGIIDFDECRRAYQIAINLFVIHELLHIRQNFPRFATVQKIKIGLGGIGLPMLDVAADTLSAWIAAHVEAYRLNEAPPQQEDVLPHFVNTLIMSYIVGAFVYDGRSKPEKRQRQLGIVLSSVLVKSLIEGSLNTDLIYTAWQPTSPLIVIDIEKAGSFNAMVVDKTPGLLISDHIVTDGDLSARLWDSVGRMPVTQSLMLTAKVLIQSGVIKPKL